MGWIAGNETAAGAAFGLTTSLFANKIQRVAYVRQPYVHLACALAGAALFHAASDWQAGKEAAIAGLLAKKGMRPSPKFE